MLRKITAANGIDTGDSLNARQNNYAWSMAEFNGYLYIGTGRNIAALGLSVYGLQPLDKVTPPEMTNLAEIWRYPLNSAPGAKWELCFRANEESKIYGFRDMAVYTDKNGVTALIAGCTSIDKSVSYTLYSTDGFNFLPLSSELPKGLNSRAFQEFNGILYCGANNTLGGEENYLLWLDSLQNGFKLLNISGGDKTPNGNIMSMAEMQGYLYIGTATGKGFEVWKSSDPLNGGWSLVVDKGAGDELNEWAMTMMPFKGHLYVGSAVTGGTISVDPEKKYVPFKGFDLIRIDSLDNWELIVGGSPINPTNPTNGERGNGKYASGFGNAFNCYCWQMNVYNDRLYVSTWDAALFYKDIIINEIKNGILKGLGFDEESVLSAEFIAKALDENKLTIGQYNWLNWFLGVVKSLPLYPRQHGFDLYSTKDGETFRIESLNGFDNSENYGLRTMLAASDGRLYMGTANVYSGCEVWALDKTNPCCC